MDYGPQGKFVRDTLRAQTADVHEALHHHSGFAALFGDALNMSDYHQLLQRMHGFYAPLDAAIFNCLDQHDCQTDFGYASRSEILKQDLVDLSLDADLGSLCKEATALVTPDSIGGVLYVIEGATLGGGQIDRAVQRHLPDGQMAGRRYWAWCRAENGRRWQMTIRFIEQLYSSGTSIEDLTSGANRTFQLFTEWMAPLDTSVPLADHPRT